MTALPEKTGTLTSADGVRIFYRHYAAESERARMVIALYFAQQFPELIDGVIASSPALGMTMGNELDASKISHDPKSFQNIKLNRCL